MKKIIIIFTIVVFTTSCNKISENIDFSDKYYSVTDIYMSETKHLYDFENRRTHVVKIRGYVDRFFFSKQDGFILVDKMSDYKLIIILQNNSIDTNALQKIYNFPLDKEFYIHGMVHYDNLDYKCLIFEQIFIETTFCK